MESHWKNQQSNVKTRVTNEYPASICRSGSFRIEPEMVAPILSASGKMTWGKVCIAWRNASLLLDRSYEVSVNHGTA